MRRLERLYAVVAMRCSGIRPLAPLCRWALRALRTLAATASRCDARARRRVRRCDPVASAARAGPRPDRRASRRRGRRDATTIAAEPHFASLPERDPP